jgi:predicted acetyltransferase
VEIAIETASAEEVGAFLRPISVALGNEPADADANERFASWIDPARMHVAREDGTVVGAAGAFTFELTVPGGLVPAAGVTVVGVLPTHRRRGILTRLMREQLDDVHRRGEPIAYLWATEERIYGRFGYGVGSLTLDTEIDTRRVAFRNDVPVPVRARLLDADEAYEMIPPIYDRVRAETPGMFSRSESWWRRRRLRALPALHIVRHDGGDARAERGTRCVAGGDSRDLALPVLDRPRPQAEGGPAARRRSAAADGRRAARAQRQDDVGRRVGARRRRRAGAAGALAP